MIGDLSSWLTASAIVIGGVALVVLVVFILMVIFKDTDGPTHDCC